MKITLKYFSAEVSVKCIEKRLVKMLNYEETFSLASSLDLVYRKYLAFELQLADQNEKEKNQLNDFFLIEQQKENQLLTWQISLVKDHVNKSLIEQISIVNDHFVTERQSNLLLKEQLGSVNDNLDKKEREGSTG